MTTGEIASEVLHRRRGSAKPRPARGGNNSVGGTTTISERLGDRQKYITLLRNRQTLRLVFFLHVQSAHQLRRSDGF